jgi:hypothetical protein
MAVYNEILVGRFNNFIKKFMGFKGQSPAPQLASEITPAFTLDNGVENRFLMSWYRWGTGIQFAPTAAQANSVRLRNPAGSKVIVVLEKVSMSSLANDIVSGGRILSAGVLVTSDLTTRNAVSLDLRQQQIPFAGMNSTLKVSSAQGTSPNTDTVFLEMLQASDNVDFILSDDQQIALMPGDCWQFDTTTVNTRTLFSAVWRERVLEESEFN